MTSLRDQKVKEGNQLDLKVTVFAGMVHVESKNIAYSRTYLKGNQSYWYGLQCQHQADTLEYKQILEFCDKIADSVEQHSEVL